MRLMTFAKRNAKEILRDPLTLFFGLGFPVGILLLFTAIEAAVPIKLYPLEKITPVSLVFGLSFMTLFSGMLLAKDRTGALLQRLYTTPLTGADYIFGYTLPLLPMALVQGALCYLLAVCMGLPLSINLLWALLLHIPASVMFISLGVLCGSVLNDKQVGGICGALLANLSGFLSGVWFDLSLIGGVFEDIAYLLPFAHATDLCKLALAGQYGDLWGHFAWITGYAVVITALAIQVFMSRMKRQ